MSLFTFYLTKKLFNELFFCRFSYNLFICSAESPSESARIVLIRPEMLLAGPKPPYKCFCLVADKLVERSYFLVTRTGEAFRF